MAKLFSLMKIIRANKAGDEETIERRTVFDATATEAKQFDALGSARPATAEEVKEHDARKAIDEGLAFQAPAPSDAVLNNPESGTSVPGSGVLMPDSGAAGDPRSAPKGKSA